MRQAALPPIMPAQLTQHRTMEIPLLSLTALFGASQGLLLSVILLSIGRGRRLANGLLACFLFAESVRLFMLMFTYGDWMLSSSWWYLLLNVTFLIGPLLYCYVATMTQPGFVLHRRQLIHLLPLCVSTVVSAFTIEATYTEELYNMPIEHTSGYRWGIVLTIIGFASLFFYALRSLKFLTPYQKLIDEEFSAHDKVNLVWLKWLIYFCIATAFISAIIELTRLSTGFDVGPRILSSLIMSVMMVYGIGIMGIRHPAILGTDQWRAAPSASQTLEEAPSNTVSESSTAPSNDNSANEKYQKSGLSQTESEQLWQKLEAYMAEQKVYLENGLKLSQLAELLSLAPNHLSQVINTHAEKSFFEYINEYRVEEAKRLLHDESKQQLSVATVAMESGFNSQNTFYNQFKKYTGTTPAKFKKLDNPQLAR